MAANGSTIYSSWTLVRFPAAASAAFFTLSHANREVVCRGGTAKREWVTVQTKGKPPSSRCNASAVVIGDSMLIFAGHSGAATNADLYEFNFGTLASCHRSSLLTRVDVSPLHRLCGGCISGAHLVAGGMLWRGSLQTARPHQRLQPRPHVHFWRCPSPLLSEMRRSKPELLGVGGRHNRHCCQHIQQ